jgi:hypothetical protein
VIEIDQGGDGGDIDDGGDDDILENIPRWSSAVSFKNTT